MLKTYNTKTEKNALTAIIILGSALLLSLLFVKKSVFGEDFLGMISWTENLLTFGGIACLAVAFFMFENQNAVKWLVFSAAATFALRTLMMLSAMMDIEDLGDVFDYDALGGLGMIASIGFAVAFIVIFALAFFRGVANPNLDKLLLTLTICATAAA